jgi:putative oxidoreductase
MAEDKRIGPEDVGRLLLRIMVGGLLLFHGLDKAANGLGFVEGTLAAHHLPLFMAYGVYLGEILAPAMLIGGVWTRLSALVIVFDLAMAIYLARLPAFFMIEPGGGWGWEVEMLYLVSALALVFLGPGRLSLGRMFGARGKSLNTPRAIP